MDKIYLKGTSLMIKVITTSWDNGFRESLQTEALLKEYDLKGTFYIPSNIVRGKEVSFNRKASFLCEEDLKRLSEDFEVSAHGVTHRDLTVISRRELKNEIQGSKKHLEKVLGKKIHGFAYPGGKLNSNVVRAVREAGYHYARATLPRCIFAPIISLIKRKEQIPFDRFKLPVTIPCTNPPPIGRMKLSLLAPFSKIYAFGADWEKCSVKAYKNIKKYGGVLHIFGHPQDLADPRSGKKLERVFSEISGDPELEYLTNWETVERLMEEGYIE